MNTISTTPDKKVPTHGPGTNAWYHGKKCKILAIENGKTKIFCDGRVLLVNYTSIDDAMYGTMHEAFKPHFLHEAYRVVDNDTHKSLFTGTKDECESFISDECDEDADVECIELKEAIMVTSDGMNPQYTLEKALSYAKGNAAAMIATNPLLYGIAVLQRKYVVVCNVLDDEGTENPAYKKLDKDVRAKYHKLLSIPGESGKKYEVFGNKDNTSFLLYYEDAFTTNWFVPAAGKINESEAQDRYQEFFKKKLADYGVSSPAELSAEDKSKFFSEIKKEWPDVKVNESLKNKTLFDKIEKWYSALSVDQKETLFYNLFRFSGQATKMAKKYKTLAQFVKMGTKNTPESGSYKHTGFGVANAIAAYYQTFKNEKDILPKLASIEMDNSKDYMKYHDIATGTTLNEGITDEYFDRISTIPVVIVRKLKNEYTFWMGGHNWTKNLGSAQMILSKEANKLLHNPNIFYKDKGELFFVPADTKYWKWFSQNSYPEYAKGTKELMKIYNINESEMAFGIGSIVTYNGEKCKVVSISNGMCKLVCNGKVMIANMGDLQQSNPINESVDNESSFNTYIRFEDLLKVAKINLSKDIFKLFARECFINGNAYILDKIIEETLKVVDASPINELVKMAKTYNNGNYSDSINKFIYNTNKLRSLQTGAPFNQRYFEKCVNLLMAFNTNPSKTLDEITADSMMFVPAKNQLEFFDLSTECINTINFIVSKQSGWKVVKQTPDRIVLAIN